MVERTTGTIGTVGTLVLRHSAPRLPNNLSFQSRNRTHKLPRFKAEAVPLPCLYMLIFFLFSFYLYSGNISKLDECSSMFVCLLNF